MSSGRRHWRVEAGELRTPEHGEREEQTEVEDER